MPRQIIALSPPNDRWLKNQVERMEFSSKSEAVNALIRKAREAEGITEHLIQAEESGFADLNPDQILAGFKQVARSTDS